MCKKLKKTTGCLLDYPYFKENCKRIVIDLNKQQAFDADPKPIWQTNFTVNLDWTGETFISFIYSQVRAIFELLQKTMGVL